MSCLRTGRRITHPRSRSRRVLRESKEIGFYLGHTRSLPDGRVVKGIRADGNLVFCFGITLPYPQALAMRPRSIGIAETDDGFVITFIESPMPVANAAMEDWALRLRRTETAPA
jgi:hypothetical protein